jgi:hypothetical protein
MKMKKVQNTTIIISIFLVLGIAAFAAYKKAGVQIGVKEGESSEAAAKLNQADIPYKSYWVSVGSENFAESSLYKLYFNPGTKRPNVVFLKNNQLNVKEFDGSKWNSVGNASQALSISDSSTDYNKYSIAQNPKNGKILFAYIDKSSGYKATVMEFDGTNWNELGKKGFSDLIKSVNIAVNPNTGEPYVTLYNNTSGVASYTVLMKYSNDVWKDIAGEDATFLVKPASNNSYRGVLISFNPKTNEPYISYVYGQSLIIKKYSEGKWIIIGESSLPSIIGNYSPVVFDSSGTPYTAYIEYMGGGENVVLKYNSDGKKWERIGYTEVYNNTGNGKIIDLEINPSDNKPYLAFDSVLPKTGDMTTSLNVVKFRKYDGKEWWIDVQGDYAYSYSDHPNSNYFSLAFNPYKNEAYVAHGLSNVSVKKFDFNTSPSNLPPVAKAVSKNIRLNMPVNITLSATDPEKDPLTFRIEAQPSTGTAKLISKNIVRYIPKRYYRGNDSFTFSANDGKNSSSPATISITIR